MPISTALHQGPHIKVAEVASRWHNKENLLAWNLNLIPLTLETDVLPLVPMASHQEGPVSKCCVS